MEKSRRQFLKFLVAVHSFILGFFFFFNRNGGFKFGKVKAGSVGTPEVEKEEKTDNPEQKMMLNQIAEINKARALVGLDVIYIEGM